MEDELLALVSYTYDLRKKFPQADSKTNFAAQVSSSVLNQNEDSEINVSCSLIRIRPFKNRAFVSGMLVSSLYFPILKLDFFVDCITFVEKRLTPRFAYIT